MSENQKKIWITGASSGIGKAVAEKFANEGWKVAVSARRKELLDELAEHNNISSFPLDVTNQSQINNVFKDILNALGEIDICLFSSGTYEPKDEQNIDPDKIKNVMNVNFLGVIDCVKVVENYFKKARRQLVFSCMRVGDADIKGHDSVKRVYAKEGKAPTLTTMQGGHREPKVYCGAFRGRYKIDGVRQDHKMKVAGLTDQQLELRFDGLTNCLSTVE